MFINLAALGGSNLAQDVQNMISLISISGLHASFFILGILLYFKGLHYMESVLGTKFFSTQNRTKLKHLSLVTLLLIPIAVHGLVLFNSYMLTTSTLWAQDKWNAEHPVTWEKRIEKIKIASLGDNSHLKGTGKYGGFLFVQAGKGSIDDVMYYRMMISKDNKKRYYQLPMNNTDIIEFEGESDFPHIEVTWDVKVRDGVVISENSDSELYGFTDFRGSISNIVIYVPKGTVSTDFNVDLK